MNPIVDTIMVILFVLFLVYIVAGFNRNQVKKHNDRINILNKREEEYKKKLKDKSLDNK